MRVYLVQHAEPKSKQEDPKRPLSDKGKEDIQRVASYIEEHLRLRIERIVHSGKLRAKQTAEILAEHLHPREGLTKDEDLEALAEPETWLGKMKESDGDIMVVGHLPHLGKLASLLVYGDKNKETVSFKMGCVVCLDQNQQKSWTIQWMITPDVV